MSRYVRDWNFETQFDGDIVEMTLRPLTQVDLLMLENVRGKSTGEVREQFAEVIKRYISNFRGLKDAAGQNLAIEDVFTAAIFLPLISTIMSELISKASVPKGKSSVGPSDSTSAELETSQTSAAAA